MQRMVVAMGPHHEVLCSDGLRCADQSVEHQVRAIDQQSEVLGAGWLTLGCVGDDGRGQPAARNALANAVAPALQRRGIGSALVPAGLAAAEAMVEPLVVLQGSPGYYPRFGFRDCRTLGIEIDLPDWAPPDAGMAYPCRRTTRPCAAA